MISVPRRPGRSARVAGRDPFRLPGAPPFARPRQRSVGRSYCKREPIQNPRCMQGANCPCRFWEYRIVGYLRGATDEPTPTANQTRGPFTPPGPDPGAGKQPSGLKCCHRCRHPTGTVQPCSASDRGSVCPGCHRLRRCPSPWSGHRYPRRGRTAPITARNDLARWMAPCLMRRVGYRRA